MRRSISSLLIILLGVLSLYAQSTWEGITAVSRYGEFPQSGNYGASNSFAMNTAVTVKNIENGRETTVIITDRLEDPGLFLLISKDAARALEISHGEIARVRASITQPAGAITTYPDDLPYNPDPDVNPAASIPQVPRPSAPDAAVVRETEITAVDEAEEPDEAAEEEEVAEMAEEEPAEPEEAVVEEPVEIAEAPPRINGVDVAAEPPAEERPAEPADEPLPPFVETPSILGLNPAPVIDQAEFFVLLAEPDVPDATGLVGEPEERDLRISSLDEPEITAEEEDLGLIVPPEPVFEERLVEVAKPVAEDILIVSDLDEPDAVAIASFDVPVVADEPTVPEVGRETPLVLNLDPAEAAAEEAVPEIADIPDVTEGTETEGPELRYSLLEEPEEPLASVAAYDIDEPAFVAEEVEPTPEDILIVSDLESPGEPGETPVDIAAGDRDEPRVTDLVPGDDTPIVVNGFAPPEYDPDEIDIVLEPAEPKPPEPRIAGADLLEGAEGEEPERDVEIAAVTKPEAPEEVAVEPPEEPEVAVVDAVEYTTELAGDNLYLQLAAFTEARPAAKLKADLSETYPVTVYLTESTDRRVYRVLVGPLSQDESGALLYRFRVKGFPDAFVRAGAVN